jgi:hypothetical protein
MYSANGWKTCLKPDSQCFVAVFPVNRLRSPYSHFHTRLSKEKWNIRIRFLLLRRRLHVVAYGHFSEQGLSVHSELRVGCTFMASSTGLSLNNPCCFFTGLSVRQIVNLREQVLGLRAMTAAFTADSSSIRSERYAGSDSRAYRDRAGRIPAERSQRQRGGLATRPVLKRPLDRPAHAS